MNIGLKVALAVFAAVPASAADRVAWLDVPYVRQEKNGCGSASLAMILGYWNPVEGDGAARARSIQRELYNPAEQGIPASSMQRYLEEHNFKAFAFAGMWSDLTEHLAQQRPLIVAMKSGHALHYAVVAGISDETVALNDPADRKLRRLSRADFEKRWKSAGRWTLLAVPRTIP